MWVQSLGREDSLEEGMATHSSILAWRFPETEEPGAPGCDSAGAAAKRSDPTSKERQLRGRRRAEGSYCTFKVRRGGHEEIPVVQGKEQL